MNKRRKFINPYGAFKRNIFNAFHLYGRVFTQKFSKKDVRLMRELYIVYLVSCLEAYFTELFKEMYNKKMLNRKSILRIKRIKQLKFNFDKLQEMENKNIGDVLVEYMNFQNMDYIYDFAKSIEFNKYSQKIRQRLNKEGSDNKKIQESLKLISKQKDKSLNNLNVSKAMNSVIVEYMVDDKILLNLYSADKCFNTIALMVHKRHEIVHKAKEMKIEHSEIWGYTMATFQFVNMFGRIYEFKFKELNKK